VLLAARPLYVPLFTGDTAVRAALMPVLAVAALIQPVAGVVFVLDGVLIGAGDAAFLAWASVGCTAVFLAGLAVLRAAVPATSPNALTGLWWLVAAFTLARLAALTWRERADTWLRTGVGV
jgi:Na+-driven multidrug efflux pump